MDNTFSRCAQALALMGFHVFPIRPNSKKPPALKDWQVLATDDALKVRSWWATPSDDSKYQSEWNIGISTSSFRDGGALLVVDVDNHKEGANGADSIFELELSGKTFPKTLTQVTPTGGLHLIYRTPMPVKQGAHVLGPGLDVRGKGGYIVGAGSRTDDGVYTFLDPSTPIADAPEWLVEACGKPKEKHENAGKALPGIDAQAAIERARAYLLDHAPLAQTGLGGDQTTFRVACKIKDMGVSLRDAFDLLLEVWNDRCVPPWDGAELLTKVENAYRYGADPVGSRAPEVEFKDVAASVTEFKDTVAPAAPSETQLEEGQHPFDKLNESYAFVTAGGGHHILWETTDVHGAYKLEHLSENSFHKKFAAWTLAMGDGKTKPVTELWMKSERRRNYRGICFVPGQPVPEGWYNLWRGFAYEPLPAGETPSPEAQKSLDMFLEHALQNVCKGDVDLYTWLIGYFAHLVQRPWDKPLVALVFRGKKGVGKNALVERIGALFGHHSLVVTDKRYLLGNFNSFLEHLLLFTLDEAFWSGDKSAEGVLKGLITGKHHVIEHKGKEPYTVDNRTRIVIIGNEDWLVPATQDERRFAVFTVGEGRLQDRAFFHDMRVRMEEGGYRLLLRYLLDFDLSHTDVNAAPQTEGLHEQKVNSLPGPERYWFECLQEGKILESDFGDGWPTEIAKESVRKALARYCKAHKISGWSPSAQHLGRILKRMAPSIDGSQKKRDGENFVNVYRFPELPQARAEWEKFIGHKENWE